MSLYISRYCSIRQHAVFLNGEKIFSAENEPFSFFIKSCYKNIGTDYMKFYKMDDLCKLAFITSEILLKDFVFKKDTVPEEKGVIIQNASSSLTSDLRHQESIENKSAYFPSPAVFVYTLPNIMIGEICIRNKFKGENILFISQEFNPALAHFYTSQLFEKENTKYCMTGWVELNETYYESFLCIIQKNIASFSDKYSIFTIENLLKIYNHRNC